ncbi:restriction endonuclease subunit S [Helicobacter pylori]
MDALTTPSNWQRVRLGTYKYRRGSFPQPYGNPQWYSDNGMPFVQVYDVGENFKLNQKTKQKISKIAQPMSVFVPKNSVIITLQGTIGRVALTQYDCYCDRTILIFDNNTLNDVNKYFFVLSLFTKFEEEKRKADGSIIKTITKQTLKDFEIPLPPLNEQIAIANVLSDLDHYLYTLDALILKKKSVKKALSFELLSQRKRLKGFNQAWQRVRLGDMTTSFTKQTGFDYSASIKPTLIKEQLPHYIPFIQNKDFSGHYINYKTDYFIPNEIAIRFPQILLNEKCLLISIVGSIGNVAVFNHSQDAFTGCAIAVLKFKEKKSLDFVMHFLMSASGQKSLLNIVKASSHKSIILADLRDLLIPLPPLNEQIAIANILSDLDHEIISLKNKKRQFDNIKKALNHDLMSAKIRVLKN